MFDANDREIMQHVVREACQEAVTPLWERYHALDKRVERTEVDSVASVKSQISQGERLGSIETGFAVLKAKIAANSKWVVAIGTVAVACAGYLLRAWVTAGAPGAQ